jgi:YYY domain-containing protein
MPNSLTFVVMITLAVIGAALALYHVKDRSLAFILLLGALAFALVAVCEVVYLRDAFDNSIYLRMNTVFKFYFQSWAMLSVACGAGFFFLFERFWTVNVSALADRILHRSWRVVWLAVLLLFLVACMAYPLSAPTARLVRYDQLNQEMRLIPGTSLDGLTYLQNCHPPDSSPDLDSDPFPFCQYDVTGDYEAIRWLNANIQGDPIIVEAYKDDYSLYSRVSAFTGLPTLMGWSGHEVQWRMGWLKNSANAASFNQRLADIDTIYTSASNQQVVDIMRHYNAQYLYVGPMEHVKYTTADLTRFARFMQVVYQAKGVTIYKLNS